MRRSNDYRWGSPIPRVPTLTQVAQATAMDWVLGADATALSKIRLQFLPLSRKWSRIWAAAIRGSIMERTSLRLLTRDRLWLLVCGMLSSLWCVTAAQQLSATFDEPGYLRMGL